MNLKGISQNLNDSVTCIPNYQLRKAINLIEKGKVTQEELDSTKQLVIYLNKRITTKDSIILRYGQKDQYWKKIQRTDKWYLITPMCVIQRPGYSNIVNHFVDYEKLMLDSVKNSRR